MTPLVRRALAVPVAIAACLPLLTCSAATTAPSARTEPVVLSSDDAVKPKEGRDYTTLMTLHGADARQATAVTDNGQVLLTSYDADDQTRFTLLDPRTGRRTKIPSPYHGTDVLAANADEIWYDGGKPMERPHVFRYDRERDRVRGFVLPDAPGESERAHYWIMGFVGRRVWFSTGNDSTRDVWSVRFRKPGTVRLETRHKINPVLDDGILAWGRDPATEGGPGYLVTRVVATGETEKARLPAGCSVSSEDWPYVNGEQVAIHADCGDDYWNTIVADTSGNVEAILDVGDENGPLSMSDRGLFFFWYLYDIKAQKVFDVLGRHAGGDANTPPASGPGDHPVMIWPRGRISHGVFSRILVVRLK